MNQVQDTSNEKILNLWTRIQNKDDLTPLKLLNEQALIDGGENSKTKGDKRVQVSLEITLVAMVEMLSIYLIVAWSGYVWLGCCNKLSQFYEDIIVIYVLALSRSFDQTFQWPCLGIKARGPAQQCLG